MTETVEVLERWAWVAGSLAKGTREERIFSDQAIVELYDALGEAQKRIEELEALLGVRSRCRRCDEWRLDREMVGGICPTCAKEQRMTEAEWQELDERLAREVMGWSRNDELIEAQGQEIPSQKRLSYCTWSLSWWGRIDGIMQFIMFLSDWQPHLKIIQAMMIKDAIAKQGWAYSLSREENAEESYMHFFFWGAATTPLDHFRGHAETDAKAICLAAEAWLGREQSDESLAEEGSKQWQALSGPRPCWRFSERWPI